MEEQIYGGDRGRRRATGGWVQAICEKPGWENLRLRPDKGAFGAGILLGGGRREGGSPSGGEILNWDGDVASWRGGS